MTLETRWTLPCPRGCRGHDVEMMSVEFDAYDSTGSDDILPVIPATRYRCHDCGCTLTVDPADVISLFPDNTQ